MDAIGTADYAGDAGVVRLVTYFELAGIFLIDHNHRAFGQFELRGRGF